MTRGYRGRAGDGSVRLGGLDGKKEGTFSRVEGGMGAHWAMREEGKEGS